MARVTALLVVALVPAAAQARDHDKLPDRWERKHHLNPRKNDAKRDRDRDGLSNLREYRAHTNPRRKDSDRDGHKDGVERRFGFKPRDRDSDDGIKDGRENAGKVKKLSAGSITIKLAAGGRLTARLACDTAGDDPAGDPTDDPSGDDESSGEDPFGDDSSGDDPSGDDPSGDDPSGDDEPAGDDSSGDDPSGDDPSGDDPSGDAAAAESRGATAFAAQDDPSPDDDAAFDRQFDEEFSGGAYDCASVRKGALVHEATVDRSGPSPVVVALELVRR